MTKAAELAKMGEVLSNSQVGRKNIIINGGMQIAQRGTSSTGLGATDGYYTVDRFKMVHGATSAGRYTMTQSAITDLEGFSNGLKLQCTTADTSIAAGELLMVSTVLEGLQVQSLAATSTSTRAFTVSFYAKSNANRAISVETNFADGTNRRAQTLHTIGTSWARYTMTVPAASSTSLPNDNTHSFDLDLWIHAGSNYTSGTMSSSLAAHDNTNRAVGIGSFFSSTDNTLELTGFQLEVGSQATPFEHRSYGEELQLCSRYYQTIIEHGIGQGGAAAITGYTASMYNSTYMMLPYAFRTELRTFPTLISSDSTEGFRMYRSGGSDVFDNLLTGTVRNKYALELYNNSDVSGTQGDSGYIQTNTSSAVLAVDAEL